jgi:transcriptional regulator with XRE-family HTH domain
MARKRQAESDRHRLRAKAFDLLRRGKAQSEVAKSCGITVRTLQRWVNESQEKVKQQGDLVHLLLKLLSLTASLRGFLIRNFFRDWMLLCRLAFRSWKLFSKILILASR